jgi:hypothetical protein
MIKTLLRVLVPLLLLGSVFGVGHHLGRRSALTQDDLSYENRRAFRKRMFERMANTLQLDQKQKEDVKAIVMEQKKKVHELRDEVHPRFREIHESTRERIKTVLNEKQRILFEKHKRDFEPKHFGRKRRRWHRQHSHPHQEHKNGRAEDAAHEHPHHPKGSADGELR